MFHPVGTQSSTIYWRRRLLLLASAIIVLVLLIVSVRAVTSSGSTPSGAQNPVADGTVPTRSTSSAPSTAPRTAGASTAPPPAGHSTAHASAGGSASPSGSGSASAPLAACQSSNLSISALVAQQSYTLGQNPTVELQVINTGSAPCVQDLADKQVVLTVYNGESRVWGSHDCETQPGTDDRTLAVGAPVRVSVVWSGMTSQANCAGTRQHVGAGTYTLYAALAGKTGKAAQFTIS